MKLNLSEMKELFSSTPVEELSSVLHLYQGDSRAGAKKLMASYERKVREYEKEIARLKVLTEYENTLYQKGVQMIGGIDEVGRGPLAGPVTAAVVILPKGCLIQGINDSKKLSAKKREELYDIIMEKAVSVGIGSISPQKIDELNILQATYEAMWQALENIGTKPEYLLVDAVTIPNIKIPQKGIVQGDGKSISIGAASIIAKVTRDRLMAEMDQLYPGYHFASNKGYGSAEHVEAIREKGLCPIHRRTFIKNIVENFEQGK